MMRHGQVKRRLEEPDAAKGFILVRSSPSSATLRPLLLILGRRRFLCMNGTADAFPVQK